MKTLDNPLDGFSPQLYLATLSEVAHSDGLVDIERALLEQQAANFGIDLNDLPAVPSDLSDVPWATRVLVYRDALMLAFADNGELSAGETSYLETLASRMKMPEKTAAALLAWTIDYAAMLDRFSELTRPPK